MHHYENKKIVINATIYIHTKHVEQLKKDIGANFKGFVQIISYILYFALSSPFPERNDKHISLKGGT